METSFWKVKRLDKAHLVCDDAGALRICWLVSQLGVKVTGSVAQGTEGAVYVYTVDTGVAFFLHLLSDDNYWGYDTIRARRQQWILPAGS